MIEIDPLSSSAHNNLGCLVERQARLPEAVAEYRRAIENKPNNRQAHFNLGRVLVNQQTNQEGIQELEKTIETADDDTPRYVYSLVAAIPCSGESLTALSPAGKVPS